MQMTPLSPVRLRGTTPNCSKFSLKYQSMSSTSLLSRDVFVFALNIAFMKPCWHSFCNGLQSCRFVRISLLAQSEILKSPCWHALLERNSPRTSPGLLSTPIDRAARWSSFLPPTTSACGRSNLPAPSTELSRHHGCDGIQPSIEMNAPANL